MATANNTNPIRKTGFNTVPFVLLGSVPKVVEKGNGISYPIRKVD